jgi:hypothetical protein
LACGTTPSDLTSASATSCSDIAVPAGTYTYTVTAVDESWTATSSASAGAVTVTAANIALVEKGTLAGGSGATFTATLPSATTAGDLVVAVFADANSNCSTDTFTAPAGWVEAAHTCRGTTGPLEVWYDPDTASGTTSVVFDTGSSGANVTGLLSEWSAAATTNPLDQTGTNYSSTSSTTLTVTTSGALSSSDELAVTAYATSAGLTSYSTATGWTSLDSDPGGGFDTNYDLDPTSGSTLTATVTSSPQTNWAAVTATFLP